MAPSRRRLPPAPFRLPFNEHTSPCRHTERLIAELMEHSLFVSTPAQSARVTRHTRQKSPPHSHRMMQQTVAASGAAAHITMYSCAGHRVSHFRTPVCAVCVGGEGSHMRRACVCHTHQCCLLLTLAAWAEVCVHMCVVDVSRGLLGSVQMTQTGCSTTYSISHKGADKLDTSAHRTRVRSHSSQQPFSGIHITATHPQGVEHTQPATVESLDNRWTNSHETQERI